MRRVILLLAVLSALVPPCGYKLAIWSEFLNAVIFIINDVNIPVFINCYSFWTTISGTPPAKFPISSSLTSPFSHKLAV